MGYLSITYDATTFFAYQIQNKLASRFLKEHHGSFQHINNKCCWSANTLKQYQRNIEPILIVKQFRCLQWTMNDVWLSLQYDPMKSWTKLWLEAIVNDDALLWFCKTRLDHRESHWIIGKQKWLSNGPIMIFYSKVNNNNEKSQLERHFRPLNWSKWINRASIASILQQLINKLDGVLLSSLDCVCVCVYVCICVVETIVFLFNPQCLMWYFRLKMIVWRFSIDDKPSNGN